ncbi:MAG: hypothetical protein WA634_16280 [Silvibacterium sp.]
MNSAGKVAVLVLVTGLVAGCRHKAKATPPLAAQAPVLPVSQSETSTPPPKLPAPQLPNVGPQPPAAPPAKPKKNKKVHHKPTHTETIPEEPAPSKPPAPTTNAASDITPIGQLSAAGESTNTPRRNEILDEINTTEKSLNDLKRPLSTEEQTTAAQTRTFLMKAKEALSQEDLDGAHTLVTKAKVLLDELTKP